MSAETNEVALVLIVLYKNKNNYPAFPVYCFLPSAVRAPPSNSLFIMARRDRRGERDVRVHVPADVGAGQRLEAARDRCLRSGGQCEIHSGYCNGLHVLGGLGGRPTTC